MGKVYRFQGAGQASRRRNRTGRRSNAPTRLVIVTVAAAAAFATQYFITHGTTIVPTASSNYLGIGCNIKGNISYYGGERIYHVPGQEYYSETRINLLKGERWFCSEAEARSAGWRKARR
ncbi:hypothetical protein RFN28_18530 [Mesorhizobium sp. VK24D]|uniref:Succinoglycan biosynthesis protein exoi n=1 Tax=Mesorhizobium album TaxID=3072314 RepID=A0ABU4Y0G8_9HYPH|nr:hypothetical protein [Mesorhizobium sp. VK24D]MDX8480445.1 hypothetical protein [Mesorhizobium sp. VK24D]